MNSLLAKGYTGKIERPAFTGIRFTITEDAEVIYTDAEKSVTVKIQNGDHLRQMVAKAIANASATGRQVEAHCEYPHMTPATLAEIGKAIELYNRSVANYEGDGTNKAYLSPSWM